MTPITLIDAPAALIENGAPQFGLWKGSLSNAAFGDLAAPYKRSFLARKLIEKKWLYTLVATPDLFFCMAIIDAGILHSFFLALFDRRTKTLVSNVNVTLPGTFFAKVGDQPDSLHASIAAPGTKASIAKSGNGVQVHARVGQLEADLRLESIHEPAPMSACGELGNARFDYTQKRVGLTAAGTIVHAGKSYPIDPSTAQAGLDLTHGFLARETSWRWAFALGEASGRKLAFNFCEGFFPTGSENVIFLDGEPHGTGPIRFSFDPKNPKSAWTLRTPDGSIDLQFAPEGERAQNIWTPLMSSQYVQPFGTFSGHITTPSGTKLDVSNVPGVTEDHKARW